MEQPRWTEGAPSAFPWEREALEFIRTRLPDHDPYRAWSNIEFVAGDGSVNEVDLLAVTPKGVFLVEIKSFPGKLFGDHASWRLERDGKVTTFDNPLLLANRKAKRLRSLLEAQPALRNDKGIWVQALVFLSNPDLDCRLHDSGRTGVCGRDGAAPTGTSAFAPLPGIVAALMSPDTAGQRGRVIDKPLSRKIAEAARSAGFRPNDTVRRLGDFSLVSVLDEGPGWQDHEAVNEALRVTRRVRIFLAGRAHTAGEQETLEQEARRAFRLTAGLDHDGILRPLHQERHALGPALLFERDPAEERLDTWAPAHLPQLGLADRVMLVRQLAEALAYAHGHGVVHRALTPRAVLVRPEPGGGWRLVVDHWHAGAQDLPTTHTTVLTRASTVHAPVPADVVAPVDVYLAPEAATVVAPSGRAMDVFGLGACAFLLLTGRAPASSLAERDELLGSGNGFRLAAVAEGLPESLQLLVESATEPLASDRPTVRELLPLLDEALEEITRPALADPFEAHRGDVLEGGWKVEQYLGKGGTAIALLAKRDDRYEVLKVAKDDAHAERLRHEHDTLTRLRHDGIVECYGLDIIAGHTALRLAPASTIEQAEGGPVLRNLAERLQRDGRPTPDLLERWGTDLIDILAYLEQHGVAHRDIKPDNLGVRPRGRNDELHLVLFDFSLTRTPTDQLAAGTVGYLDPFLGQRPARRWDQAAERYAAAVTLYELATGTRPVWGDGLSDPALLPDELPRIDVELFDANVRDGLAAFFRQALHRDPERRHHTAEEMRRAWQRAFRTGGTTTTTLVEPPSAEEVDRALESVVPDTPAASLPVSGAALAALERLGVLTAEALARYPLNDLNATVGVGSRVRNELRRLAHRLRDLGLGEPVGVGESLVASADLLFARLVPTGQAPMTAATLEAVLGLHPDITRPWPSRADVIAALHLDRDAYDRTLRTARHRWSREPFGPLRKELGEILGELGGVAAADEVARGLLARHGSAATGEQRLRVGRALTRAALEADRGLTNPTVVERRDGDRLVLVAAGDDPETANEVADYAMRLAAQADELAAEDPLPTPGEVLTRLRQVPVPAGFAPLPDTRLVRLAAAASRQAAVSPRLELYRRGLPAEQALTLCRTVLLGRGVISEELLRRRVEDRFPDAAPLPGHDRLVELVREHVGLEWQTSDGTAGFVVPRPPMQVASTAFGGASGGRTATGPVPDEQAAAATAIEGRLVRLRDTGGYVVATVAARHLTTAERRLADLGFTVVSVEERLLATLRALADEQRRPWDRAVLATDADGPDGRHWAKLCDLAGDAVATLEADLLATAAPVALTRCGLLARYGQLGVLDRLRERLTRGMLPDQRLASVVVLVPAMDPGAKPLLDGVAVPVTTDNEWLVLAEPWVRHAHRPAASDVATPTPTTPTPER